MDKPKGPIYDNYEDILHRHYDENYDDERYPIERYEVAYTYGFNMATDEAYESRNWLEVEEEARQGWEEKDAGPWKDFQEAIQHAWETAKEAMSS